MKNRLVQCLIMKHSLFEFKDLSLALSFKPKKRHHLIVAFFVWLGLPFAKRVKLTAKTSLAYKS